MARRAVLGVLAVGVLLVPTLALGASTERIRAVAADERAARAAILKASDVDHPSAWKASIAKTQTGGSIAQQACDGYTPRLAKDVITGASHSDLQAPNTGETFDSTAFILGSESMAEDHFAQIAAPSYVACFLNRVAVIYKASVQEIGKLPAKAGTRSYAMRLVMGFNGTTKARVAEDVVYAGSRRVDIVLIHSFQIADNTQLAKAQALETRLAARMLARSTALAK